MGIAGKKVRVGDHCSLVAVLLISPASLAAIVVNLAQQPVKHAFSIDARPNSVWRDPVRQRTERRRISREFQRVRRFRDADGNVVDWAMIEANVSPLFTSF